MKKIEHAFELLLFNSRWLLAPFFIGLVFAILVLLFKFGKELLHLMTNVMSLSGDQAIVSILTLVDTSLIAILMLIIIFSGYENFVSKMDFGDHEDRPSWMGKVSFSDLKLKLIGAIVAISAVELLKAFINSDHMTHEQLTWKVVIHIVFVVSGVLFALTDWIASRKGPAH